VETIERIDEWRESYQRWKRTSEMRGDDLGAHYPWVENRRAPFKALGRALPMLNLALITSAGAYIDGSEPFDVSVPGGDASFREIPTLIEAGDLRWAARGYDPAAVEQDMNAQVPLERLFEFAGNGIIGQLNPVFWSFCGFIPSAARFADNTLPQLVERVKRYSAQAALIIPASRVCHQSMGLAARALEAAGHPDDHARRGQGGRRTRPPASCGLLQGRVRQRRRTAELPRTSTPHPRRNFATARTLGSG
jgi:D-proline reductase (dithiol) PrdB